MSLEITIIVLLIIGLAFMTLEAFVASFGIFGIGGAGAFIAALIMLGHMDRFYGIDVNIPILAGLGIAGLAVMHVSLYFAWKAIKAKITAGAEILPGMEALVLSWEGAKGRVHVQGEEWAAASADALAAGDRVVIERLDLLTLTVKKAS